MKKSILLIVLSLFLISDASAFDGMIKKKIFTFGEKEELDSLLLYDIFHHNAPEDFQTPNVPTVAVVGKGGKFILGIGGNVKAVMGWDIGHPIESADEFITSRIPMTPMDGDNSRFSFSARQTHLFINFVALPGTGNEIGAFISANLLNGYLPTLQFAYLKYRGIQAGYDYSLFSDPSCGAPAVDYEGPSSNTTNPVGGINYTWEPNPHGRWELAVGLEMPQTSFTTVDGRTRWVYQRAPDIPLAAKYAWQSGSSWVRASAILRTLTYRNELLQRNKSRFGYGFQLSGAWNIVDPLTLYYQAVWGKGIASMIQDTLDENLDMTPTDGDDSLSPVMLWGGFASLEYAINDRWTASATYSHVRTYVPRFAGGSEAWGDLYKYAQYVSANVFYDLTSYFEIGMEYIWGRRANNDGLKCSDNRIQMSFQLSF